MRILLPVLIAVAACTGSPGEKPAPPEPTGGIASDVKALGEDVNQLAQRVAAEVRGGTREARDSLEKRVNELTSRATDLQQKVKEGVSDATHTSQDTLARARKQLEELRRKLDEQVGQGGAGGP